MDAGDRAEADARETIKRARFALRVTKALQGLDPEIDVIPDTEGGASTIEYDYRAADFIVQHLDLRIRVLLIPEASTAEGLTDPAVLRDAAKILRHWPDTSAVALVANDESLSCYVIDPFEGEETIGVPSGGLLGPHVRGESLPISEAVTRFINSAVPDWPRDIDKAPPLSKTDAARVAPDEAVQARGKLNLAGKSAHINEKKAALKGISHEDASWAADVVIDVISGRVPSSIEELLEQPSDQSD